MKNNADLELEAFLERVENKLIARVEGTLHAHTSEQRRQFQELTSTMHTYDVRLVRLEVNDVESRRARDELRESIDDIRSSLHKFDVRLVAIAAGSASLVPLIQKLFELFGKR